MILQRYKIIARGPLVMHGRRSTFEAVEGSLDEAGNGRTCVFLSPKGCVITGDYEGEAFMAIPTGLAPTYTNN